MCRHWIKIERRSYGAALDIKNRTGFTRGALILMNSILLPEAARSNGQAVGVSIRMPWKTISILKDGSEQTIIDGVSDAFEKILEAVHMSNGAWLLADKAPYPSPVKLYFSPRAAALAEPHIGLDFDTASGEPKWRSLALLVGSGRSPL